MRTELNRKEFMFDLGTNFGWMNPDHFDFLSNDTVRIRWSGDVTETEYAVLLRFAKFWGMRVCIDCGTYTLPGTTTPRCYVVVCFIPE